MFTTNSSPTPRRAPTKSTSSSPAIPSAPAGRLGAGRDIWAKRYAPLGAINLSISADNAQALLWRLENGELAPLHPKMLILLIGANNLGESPEAVAYAVWANVAYIRKTLPNTRVLVQGIFERENPPADAGRNAKVNALLARLDDGKMVKFLDFSTIPETGRHARPHGLYRRLPS